MYSMHCERTRDVDSKQVRKVFKYFFGLHNGAFSVNVKDTEGVMVL